MQIPEPISDLIEIKTIRGKRYWKPFMQKYNCRVICEVGVFAGRNFGRMIEHDPDIAIAVDMWKEDGIYEHNDSGFSQSELDNEYRHFCNRMKEKRFVNIYKEHSLEAVKHFPDEYFDFIYIDADHTFEGTLSDLQSWYPKLKKGRFFIGDDYNRTVYPTQVTYDVKGAVEKFSSVNKLQAYEIPGNEWATGWAIIKPS